MNKEEITIGFKEQTGLRISKNNVDISTGKVVINGIEITSVENLEKVINSLDKLQSNWNELKEWLEERNICFCEEEILTKMQEIEGGENDDSSRIETTIKKMQ